MVATTDLHALSRIGQCKGVIDVLGRSPDVRLIVDVPAAQIPAARWTEGQVKFELSDAQTQRIRGQLEEAADVHEPEVAIPQTSVPTRTADAEIVIHPESDIASKIARHEDAE